MFDEIMERFKAAWERNYPNEPFIVGECVTEKAMAFIAGYVEGGKRDDP